MDVVASLENAREKLLRIDSTNRSNGTNTAFTVSFSNDSTLQNISKMFIQSVCFPHVIYNIRTGINDTLIGTTDGVSFDEIVIAEGWYDIDQLITVLEAEIEANKSGTATITLDDNTCKLNFLYTGDNYQLLAKGKEASAGYGGSAVSNLSPNIGIINNTALSASYDADCPPDLRGVKQVFLHSRTIYAGRAVGHHVDTNESLNLSSVLAIPVDASFKQYQHFRPTTETEGSTIFPREKNFSQLEFRLRDEDGNLLDICDNYKILINILAYYD